MMRAPGGARLSRFGIGIIFALLAGPVAGQEPLQLLTEDYLPYATLHNGRPEGSSVDQVAEIMKRAGLDYTMSIEPWARAISTAESDRRTCVFTTTLLPERRARFKWVLPLAEEKELLVRRAGSGVAPKTLAEAKTYTMAVHRGDSAEISARKLGFTRLDSAPTLTLSVKKLVGGRVDLMIMTEAALKTLVAEGKPLEKVMSLATTRSGIACNLGVPDAVVAAMQAALDTMIADRTQHAILERHRTPG